MVLFFVARKNAAFPVSHLS